MTRRGDLWLTKYNTEASAALEFGLRLIAFPLREPSGVLVRE
jgi:hypothetical protein